MRPAEVQMRGEREQRRTREAGGLGRTVKAKPPELAGGLNRGEGAEDKQGEPGFRYGSHFRPEVPSFLIYPLVF